MRCNFTYHHYKEIINNLKGKGFAINTVHEYLSTGTKGKVILIRHDVDFCIDKALEIAKIEKLLGVRSTFFIRFRGIVDPFSASNSKKIKKISDMGNEIGIHYDSNIGQGKEFKECIRSVKTRFESIISKKVHGAALHRVKHIKDTNEINKPNFIEAFLDELGLEYDAYSDKLMNNFKYISDSARNWRGGCVCQHTGQYDKLYLLLHPEWWSSTTTSLVTIIEEIVGKKKPYLF